MKGTRSWQTLPRTESHSLSKKARSQKTMGLLVLERMTEMTLERKTEREIEDLALLGEAPPLIAIEEEGRAEERDLLAEGAEAAEIVEIAEIDVVEDLKAEDLETEDPEIEGEEVAQSNPKHHQKLVITKVKSGQPPGSP